MKFCLEVWAEYLLPWSRNFSSLSLCGFILKTVCIVQIHCRKQRNGAANGYLAWTDVKWETIFACWEPCASMVTLEHWQWLSLELKPWKCMEGRCLQNLLPALCLSLSFAHQSISLYYLSYFCCWLIVCFYLLLCINNHLPVIYYNISSVLFK